MPGNADPSTFARHHALICGLYETHKLKDVMKIMEEKHGFRATRKQFQYYLSKWGQDKKHKEPEMIAIVVMHRQRRLQGLDSEFYVRGQLIPYEKVLHYWRRRNKNIDTLVLNEPIPDTIRCITPDQSLSRSSTIVPMSTPPALKLPEEALFALKSYIRGSFDSNTWSSTAQNLYPLHYVSAVANAQAKHGLLMDTLHKQLRLACDYFSLSKPKRAGRCLSKAFDSIGELTRVGYPPLLDRLPRTLIGVAKEKGRIKIAHIVLQHFGDFTKQLHSESHPFHKFCALLTSIQLTSLVESICAAVALVENELTTILGPFHRTTLASRYTYIRTVLAEKGLDEEADGFRKLVRQCKEQLGGGDPRTLKAGSDFALFLKRSGQFHEGKWEAEKIIEETSRAVDEQDGNILIRDSREAKICARGYSILGHCEYGLGSKWTPSAINRKEYAKRIFQSLGDEHFGLIEEEDFYIDKWRMAESPDE